MNKRFAIVLAAVALTSAGLFAQPDGAKESPTTAPVVENPEAADSPFFAEAELTWVSAYYSRGYNFGDDSLLLQPQVTAGYTVYEEGDFAITPWANVWANVTDEHYQRMDYFEELDLTGGADFSYDRLTLSPQYIYYHSPADAFGDTHALGLSAAFDDTDLYGCPVGLRPFAALFHEIDDEDAEEGTCLELGIKPQIEFTDMPLAVSFPVSVGLNIDDFYDNDTNTATMGYWSVGVKGKYLITDNWFATASLTYVRLTADSTADSNDGDKDDVFATASVGYTF